MTDGFLSLRHDAIVGGHHDHGDVRHLGAAGAHLGKGLVARGVQESYGSATVIDAPGPDDLGDAARFRRHNIAPPDSIQQRCLTVVDVAHDGNDRSSRHQVGQGILHVQMPLDVQLTSRFQGNGFRQHRIQDGVDGDVGVGAAILQAED